jgi:hypothetical protein
MNTEVKANRPDTIVMNKNEKTYIMIDTATLEDRNVTQKEADKGEKYKRLCTEIQRMWEQVCALTGKCWAISIVTKGLKNCKPYQESIQMIHYKRQLY